MDQQTMMPADLVLSEAAAWCARSLESDTAASLRNPELLTNSMDRDAADWTDFDWRAQLTLLSARRSRLLDGASAGQIAPGQLLAFLPGRNQKDGAAEAASGGFFDSQNVPAWDTWICFLPQPEPVLLAWVPPERMAAVTKGIEANTGRCLVWAKDLKLDLPALAAWL